MAKSPTQWSQNTARSTPVITYDQAIAYDSTTTKYDAIDITLPIDGKNTSAWSNVAKSKSAWSANPASQSTDTYEPTGVTYDTIFSKYDGNQSVTASPASDKLAGVWS